MRRFALLPLAFAAAIAAQGPTGAPLPANYKVVLDNAYVQVQRVHYGPHETVPMHDHPGVSTVYVYLSNDKGFDIQHETGMTIHRPGAHIGALRVSPGAFERHAVVNNTDTASDFLRIELKTVPVHGLPAETRIKAPTAEDAQGMATVYESKALHIERLLCGVSTACDLAASPFPAVVVDIPRDSTDPAATHIDWLDAGREMHFSHHGKGAYEILRVELKK